MKNRYIESVKENLAEFATDVLFRVAALCLVVFVLGLLTGCTQMTMERTDKDGTIVKFTSGNLFQNSTMSKLTVDNKTAQTYSGLKIGALENDTNVEAMKALGEILGNAAAAAARKAIVP